jgi:hypothetical protein
MDKNDQPYNLILGKPLLPFVQNKINGYSNKNIGDQSHRINETHFE